MILLRRFHQSQKKEKPPFQFRRFAVAYLIHLFLILVGMMITGMIVVGQFTFLQTVFLSPFVVYGILSSVIWLLRNREDAFTFQTILSKIVMRRFKKTRSKIKERIE